MSVCRRTSIATWIRRKRRTWSHSSPSHNTAVVPNLIAADRGFPSSWKRIQQEDRELFSDPDFRAYYPEYAVQDLMDNVKSPEEELDAGPDFDPHLRLQEPRQIHRRSDRRGRTCVGLDG